MKLLFLLFFEFFKIGLFAVGGGLATIPFLNQLAMKYPWFTVETLVDMIAISESTPGAMGVNMATYAGFTTSGLAGSLAATVGLVLPSIIIIIIIAGFLRQFKDSPAVKAVFSGLKPAVAALILSAAMNLVNVSIINIDAFHSTGSLLDLFPIKNIILFAVLLFLSQKHKAHPIVWISLAAVAGILFQF